VKRLTDSRPKHEAAGSDATGARPSDSSSNHGIDLCHCLDLRSTHMMEQMSLGSAQRYCQRFGQLGVQSRGIPFQMHYALEIA